MADPNKPTANKPTDAPNQETAKPKNRFEAIFCNWIFRNVGKATTYDNSDGSKSRALASVSLELLNPITGKGSGAFVSGQIKAVQAKGAAKTRPVFTWLATLTKGQCIKAESNAAAQAEMEAFGVKVANDYATWRKSSGEQIVLNPDQMQAEEMDITL